MVSKKLCTVVAAVSITVDGGRQLQYESIPIEAANSTDANERHAIAGTRQGW